MKWLSDLRIEYEQPAREQPRLARIRGWRLVKQYGSVNSPDSFAKKTIFRREDIPKLSQGKHNRFFTVHLSPDARVVLIAALGRVA
jgi:hypothetical protein